MAAKADKESATPESRQATSAEVDVSSPSPSLYSSMSASFASPRAVSLQREEAPLISLKLVEKCLTPGEQQPLHGPARFMSRPCW